MLHRPMFWGALAFVSGLALPCAPETAAGCSLLAAAAFAGTLFLVHASIRPPLVHGLGAALLGVGFLATGLVARATAGAPQPGTVASLVARHPVQVGRGVDIEGQVGSCRARRDGTHRVECDVRVDRIRVGRIDHPIGGSIRVVLPSPGPAGALPERGAPLSFFATLRIPAAYRNPGGFDVSRHLLARGVQATGWIKSWRLVTVHARAVGPVTRGLRSLDRLRAAMLRTLEGAFGSRRSARQAAGVCEALLVGERSLLEPHDTERLAASGLIHLLAVSGFNVAVLVSCLLALPRLLGRGRRAAALVSIPVLLGYLLLNRAESSVVRAVIMAILVLAGSLGWLRPDLLNLLGAAAITILGVGPLQFLDPGFQLTFMASLGLIVVARGKTARGLLGLSWRMSCAATLTTLPIVAFHFNRVTPAAIPANLLAAPLMAVTFLLSILLEMVCWGLGTLLPGGGPVAVAGICRVIETFVGLVFAVADAVAGTPWLTWRRPTPALPLIATHYLALLAWSLTRRSGSSRLERAGLLGVLGAACLLAIPLDTRDRPQGLRVTMLDVGQGESILVETEGGERLLVDAGGSTSDTFDVGERVVSRALWSLGLARLDRIVLTHPDRDHAGGVQAVVRNFRPREIWLARAQGGPGDEALVRPLQDLERGALNVRRLARGDVMALKGGRAVLLHPQGRGSGASNERSLVILFEGSGRRALFMGDAGATTERSLASLVPRVDLLKVGHHGSGTGTTAPFLRRVAPRLALISCGRSNRFGHPHEPVTRRLEESGVWTCRTDLDGSIEVTLRSGSTHLGAPCGGR